MDGLLDGRFLAYVVVFALLIVTPGPDTALVIRNALGSGARAATVTAFGIGAGSLVWAAASLLGVAALIQTSATAFTIFKFAGGAYLAYLGLRSLFALSRAGVAEAGVVSRPAMSDGSALRQGLLGNLLNPKAAAIFVTLMPQFIQPGDSPLRLFLMLAAYEAILLPWLAAYGHLVSRAGRSRFGTRIRAWLNRVTGAALIGLGVRLALERR
ncbi:MAG: LysE family translocator [Candidatus Dormibacteraeota bacterium]|nr:LysE family translocator [Candidatus Dormibacteraeota bacterium]